jgi:hypothetical protein
MGSICHRVSEQWRSSNNSPVNDLIQLSSFRLTRAQAAGFNIRFADQHAPAVLLARRCSAAGTSENVVVAG